MAFGCKRILYDISRNYCGKNSSIAFTKSDRTIKVLFGSYKYKGKFVRAFEKKKKTNPYSS